MDYATHIYDMRVLSEIHFRAFTIAEALSVTIAEIFFGPIAIITRSISSSMTLAV